MCGIWCILGSYNTENILEYFNKISQRGPDNSRIWYYGNLILGFHRLSIMDLSSSGNQPFRHSKKNIDLICNGEIYNHDSIRTALDITTSSKSDCEVVLYIYDLLGIYTTLKKLDGEFAFIIYDQSNDKLIAARDPFGIRPLFMGINKTTSNIIFSSEIKGIPNDYTIEPVKPGYYYTIDMNIFKEGHLIESIKKQQYYSYVYYVFPNTYNRQIEKGINTHLKRAVYKRLMSDRPIGCLLSGGLDSSLIAGIAAQKIGKKLFTFSIGMKNSPDIQYAKEVADYIGSTHHEVVLDKDKFLNAIDDVIYTIESYDTTTVRASVGHYLIAEYIKKNTDIKVILGGEGADELCGGYIYFQKAPSPNDFNFECMRLLKCLYLFDILRSDRCVSSKWGLEGRVPFLDKDLVAFYMSIDPNIKSDGNKDLLRNAFASDYIIPDNVLRRKKEAFSDGVSNIHNSWHKIIEMYMKDKVTDKECPPNFTKEEYYYRKKFIEFYGEKKLDIIPYYWKPNEEWVGKHRDPSARTLEFYN